MVFNIRGGAQCCALECDWTSLLCFCEDDGSTAIVRTHSVGGRSISMLAPPRPLADRFLVWFLDLFSGGSSWILSFFLLVLLGFGHVACIGKTNALLLSLWLSCGGGAFKIYQDVLLSIRSITVHGVISSGAV